MTLSMSTPRPDDPPWATPLAWAEKRGHPEIAEILRRHGDDQRRFAGDLDGRSGRLRSGRRQFVDRRSTPRVHHQRVAAFQQVQGHWLAHDPQSDEPDNFGRHSFASAHIAYSDFHRLLSRIVSGRGAPFPESRKTRLESPRFVIACASACGHAGAPSAAAALGWRAEPRTCRSEARHQREFAPGVGPRRH